MPSDEEDTQDSYEVNIRRKRCRQVAKGGPKPGQVANYPDATGDLISEAKDDMRVFMLQVNAMLEGAPGCSKARDILRSVQLQLEQHGSSPRAPSLALSINDHLIQFRFSN